MTNTPTSDKRARNVKRLARFGRGIAAAGAIVAARLAPGVLAQAAPAVDTAQTTVMTTTIGQTQPLTVSQTEGPYFKTNSPERSSLVTDGMQGTLLTITGQVLAADGTPVANALLDFWQATEWQATGPQAPPFWAFAWPGSQALARYIIDAPTTVAHKRVLDFGSGCGLAAIAAVVFYDLSGNQLVVDLAHRHRVVRGQYLKRYVEQAQRFRVLAHVPPIPLEIL